jgi:hypothetical protein
VKFKVEVIADNSGKWCGNAMVYDTYGEAKDAAIDLMNRWLLVREWRVVEVADDLFDEPGEQA